MRELIEIEKKDESIEILPPPPLSTEPEVTKELERTEKKQKKKKTEVEKEELLEHREKAIQKFEDALSEIIDVKSNKPKVDIGLSEDHLSEVNSYIIESLRKGFDVKSVKKALMATNWPEDIVDQLVQDINNKSLTKKTEVEKEELLEHREKAIQKFEDALSEIIDVKSKKARKKTASKKEKSKATKKRNKKQIKEKNKIHSKKSKEKIKK